MKYEAIIYWSEEDVSFIAEFPELAGCKADGLTYVEALENSQKFVEEWILIATEVGRVIPKPKES